MASLRLFWLFRHVCFSEASRGLMRFLPHLDRLAKSQLHCCLGGICEAAAAKNNMSWSQNTTFVSKFVFQSTDTALRWHQLMLLEGVAVWYTVALQKFTKYKTVWRRVRGRGLWGFEVHFSDTNKTFFSKTAWPLGPTSSCAVSVCFRQCLV